MRVWGLIGAALLLGACAKPPDDGWRRATAAEQGAYRQAVEALEAARPGLAAYSEQLILAEGQPLLLERSVQAPGKGKRISATLAVEPAPTALWERVRRVQNADLAESSDSRAARLWALLSPGWPRPWTDGRWVCLQTQVRRLRGWDGGDVHELWARSLAEPGRGYITTAGKDVILVSTERLLPPGEAPDLGEGSHRSLDLRAMRAALREQLKASDSLREALASLRGGAEL
jgi:hypothetical protein